jgi:signal transduction histidine kinase
MSDKEPGLDANLRNDAKARMHRLSVPQIARGAEFDLAVASYLLALISVAIATAVFLYCRRWISANEAPLFYLPVVMACAVRLGFVPALFAAAVCFLSWDYYFLPPYHTFTVDSQSSWVSIIVFLITAVTTGGLAARARERARAAAESESDIATLLSASELVSQSVDSDEILTNLVREAWMSCDSTVSVILEKNPETGGFTPTCSYGDDNALKLATPQLQSVAASLSADVSPVSITEGISQFANGIYAPIHYDGESIGVLYVGASMRETTISTSNLRLIATLAGYAGVVIARKRATIEAQARIRQSAILEERHRLAQEVHDTLSNTFNSIKFMLEAAKRSSGTASASDCVDIALRLSIEGAQEARRSVWALRPVAFDDSASLTSAIRRMAASSPKVEKPTITVSIVGEPKTLSERVEDNILRIAQEAITNARHHANASLIEIGLDYKTDVLELKISDDGEGFDPTNYESDGYGLESMRSRATFIGAKMDIDSSLGKGTKVVVTTPIEEDGVQPGA